MELMIVMGVIGLLATISLVSYSNYQAKAKVTAAMAEISAGKATFDELLNGGGSVSLVSDIGLRAATTNCNIAVTSSTISCSLVNAPSQVNGRVITWTRDSVTAQWSCSTNIVDKEKFAPKTCQN